MIHAKLFLVPEYGEHDRSGHGEDFKRHMHRINQATGANITVSLAQAMQQWFKTVLIFRGITEFIKARVANVLAFSGTQLNCIIFHTVFVISDPSYLPCRSWSLQSSLVAMCGPLPFQSAILRSGQTLHEPSPWTEWQVVRFPSNQLWWNLHQSPWAFPEKETGEKGISQAKCFSSHR